MATNLVGESRPAVCLAILVLTSCGGGGSSGSAVTYTTIGGTVSGLNGSGLMLADNGSDHLAVSGNGSFTFANKIPGGGGYSISVLTQPTNPSQTCVVGNGSGKVGVTAITNASVTCGFAVGGTVTGLTGAGLILRNNGGDDLTVFANGAFVFGTPLADGATFSVSVSAQPSVAAQNCVVMNAGHSGTIHGAGVTTVTVVCTHLGRFGYVAYSGSNNVAGFAIDPVSGALSAIPGTPFAIVADSVAVVPGAPFVYTSSMGFRIDADTGALIALTGGGPNGTPVAVDPKGRFVYALYQGGVTGPCCPQLPEPGTVAEFGVNPDTGVLTEVSGSPFAVGIDPQYFAFDPHGKFVYVANGGSIHLGSGSSSVSAFAIDAATGALTPVAGSPFAYGGAAEGNSVVIEPSGTFAYIAGGTSPYKIDPTTGALAPVDGAVASGLYATPIAFDPSGTFAYAPCDSGTCGYRLDSATGALTPLAGSPLTGLGSPSLLAFEPSGKFLLGMCAADVCEFSLDPTSGALTPVPGGRLSTPGTSGPNSVAIAD